MSAVATSRPSCASTMRVSSKESEDRVGEDVSSLGYNDLCVLPSAHVLPFRMPDIFSLIKLITKHLSFPVERVLLLS
jgi:hypothetical protein